MTKMALLWLTSLAVVGLIASALTAAQVPAPSLPVPGAAFGRVVSADELGFRVEGSTDGMPTGSLVIRINGQWVTVNVSPGPARPRLLR